MIYLSLDKNIHIKRERYGDILTESQEEMRRLLECGANRILVMASPIASFNSKQDPFIL